VLPKAGAIKPDAHKDPQPGHDSQQQFIRGGLADFVRKKNKEEAPMEQ
jgi:hypothetical protein